MISVTYPEGTVRQFDNIDDEVERNVLLSSLMSVKEMRRFFTSDGAKDVAKALELDSSGSETAICTRLYKHFNGDSK